MIGFEFSALHLEFTTLRPLQFASDRYSFVQSLQDRKEEIFEGDHKPRSVSLPTASRLVGMMIIYLGTRLLKSSSDLTRPASVPILLDRSRFEWAFLTPA
jgi:hypothetical protein